MIASLDRVSPDAKLPGVAHLLVALAAAPQAVRALELLAIRDDDGIASPFLDDGASSATAVLGAAVARIAHRHDGTAFELATGTYGLLLPPEVPVGIVAGDASSELTTVSSELAARLLRARVNLPLEAEPTRAALALGLQRLRARARQHPRSPGRQTRDVLLALLSERMSPDDQARRPSVVGDAVAVARHCGLEGEELDDLVRAAELQDIGMVVLRSSVLEKSAPLTPEEWAVIRHHPVVGERVLTAAPDLASVARIVRSCYERFDGSGYPDGASGTDIPLSARIIAVCVAYHAMVVPRPYRPSLSPAAALRELHRCAGTQFDPDVVAIFDAVVSARGRRLHEPA